MLYTPWWPRLSAERTFRAHHLLPQQHHHTVLLLRSTRQSRHDARVTPKHCCCLVLPRPEGLVAEAVWREAASGKRPSRLRTLFASLLRGVPPYYSVGTKRDVGLSVSRAAVVVGTDRAWMQLKAGPYI